MIGKRILIDPMGGLYFDENLKEYRWQKKPIREVQSDVLTMEIAYPIYDVMRTVGADVYSTRCLRKTQADTGESGNALYKESAYLYLRNCRLKPSLREHKTNMHLPEWVWNDGATALERDRKARANYAKYLKADLVIVVDITNYAVDEGLEAAHNGKPEAEIIADKIIRETAKRTRRRMSGVRYAMDDESAYMGLDMPVVIINCGSSFNPFTQFRLQQSWYRESLALGIFAGAWKHYVPQDPGPGSNGQKSPESIVAVPTPTTA
jgi:hypothetical protein